MAILLTLLSEGDPSAAARSAFFSEKKNLHSPTSSRRRELAANAPPASPGQRFHDSLELGLTLREVRWILDDHEAAGLADQPSVGTAEDYTEDRRKQHGWLLEILQEGLLLSPEQKVEVAGRLDILHKEASARLIEAVEKLPVIEHQGQKLVIITSTIVNDIKNPSCWLEDEAYLPWNLTGLTAEQMTLVRLPEDAEPLPAERGPRSMARRIFPVRPTHQPEPQEEIWSGLHKCQLMTLLLLDESQPKKIRERLQQLGE